jgi:Ca2+-binding RTX toxin-like protein
LTVTATDADSTTLTYSILGGADSALFTINSSTGALSFLAAPDYENPTDAGANNVYDVTVRASDGTLFDDQAIAVTVTNVNEAPASDPNDYDTGTNPALDNNSYNFIPGTANADDLTSPTLGKSAMYGRQGDDKLTGGNGADYLYGGSGNDRLYGMNGPDHLFGGSDDDILVGGSGNDTLTGGFGNDKFQFWTPNDAGDTITDYTPGAYQ